MFQVTRGGRLRLPAATWLSHIKSSLSHLVVFDLIERSSLSIKLRSETQHILPSNLSLTVQDRFRLTSEVMETPPDWRTASTGAEKWTTQLPSGLPHRCRGAWDEWCETSCVSRSAAIDRHTYSFSCLLCVKYSQAPHERSCVSQALFARQCGHKFVALNKGIVLYQTHSTA